MLKRLLLYGLSMLILALAGCGGGNVPTPTPTDNDLINDLLDQYQSEMKNKNAELLASLCVFPFNDIFSGGIIHNTAAEMIYWYQMVFTSIKSVDICEITSRIVIVNGNNAIVDGYYHFKCTLISGGDPMEYLDPVEITAVKDNGTWKLSAIVQAIT